MTDQQPPSAHELFERLKLILYSGEHPFIGVDMINVTGTVDNVDTPAAFVISFVGTDINSGEGLQAVHVQLNPTQLAQLMEEMARAAIAGFRFAVTGEQTHRSLDGTVQYTQPKEGEPDNGG